ncbi:aquaporin-1 [Pimephales promelas]|uniref:aquaporin-1 n=1 Tax=Pimephales promelas TaxID=90988 RepID=UPI001955D3B6|nr:aquaporin-1 [Pimephales promelas]
MGSKEELQHCTHWAVNWIQPVFTTPKVTKTSEEYMRAFSIKGLNQFRPSTLAPLTVYRKDQASGQKKAGIRTAKSKLIATGDLIQGAVQRKHNETHVHVQFDPEGWSLSWDSITDEPLPTLDSDPACSTDPLRVSFAFGVSLALARVCLGKVHLNPVVTLALVAGLRVSPWRAVLLVGAQLLGALSACALLLGITPIALRSNMGVTEVAPGVYLYQAVLVEMAVTFQLVLCVQAATHPKSGFSSVAPAVIGLSVILGHLMAIGFTGCGMNPARSFGPAVLTMNFHNHWVYWLGPCTGSLLAWLLHDLVLHPRWSCLGDWVTECMEVLWRDLSKQPRGPENNIEGNNMELS